MIGSLLMWLHQRYLLSLPAEDIAVMRAEEYA
jgi:hypothetical protein